MKARAYKLKSGRTLMKLHSVHPDHPKLARASSIINTALPIVVSSFEINKTMFASKNRFNTN